MSNRHRVLLLFGFFVSATPLFGGGGKEIPRQRIPDSGPEPSRISGAAVLESGPIRRYGIFVLPANAIGHYEGVYADGEATLAVRYTKEDIIIPADWVTGLCGSEPVRFTLENKKLYYLYAAKEGWFVFFEVPEEYGKTCPFIERFLMRLRYFKSVSKSEDSVPFPAIVEVPEG